MRQILLVIIFALLFIGTAYSKHGYSVSVNFGIFYSSLTPYGEWIACDFGYVWRPLHVAHGWRPYLHGRWVWTRYGWYWASYEPFGWATFHYGRWYYDDYYGWIWIPDDVWGPAWVEWRYDNDYIGWAPLPPHATFSLHIGITFANRWIAPVHYWNFVPCRYFTTTRIVEYVQPIERTRRIFGHTRGVVNIRTENNRIINRGVDVDFVEQKTNRRIREVQVVHSDHDRRERIVREANRERVEVFRPKLENRKEGETIQPPNFRKAERPIIIDREQPRRAKQDERTKELFRGSLKSDQPTVQHEVEKRRYESPRPLYKERSRELNREDTFRRNDGERKREQPERRSLDFQKHRSRESHSPEVRNREAQRGDTQGRSGRQRNEQRSRGRRP
ncbi:MAG: hypothetical protein HY707_04830 [Ignavibacteriae bacterium]|nr:hypothetical protein [Ignavibacteriota bacterium]